MTINTALTVPIILFQIIFIALFHVLGHADHKNDFYLFFILFIFFIFIQICLRIQGGEHGNRVI